MIKHADGSIEYSFAEVEVFNLIARHQACITSEHMFETPCWSLVRKLIQLCKDEPPEFAKELKP